MSSKNLAKIAILAFVLGAFALDAQAEFLMCRDGESASEWRKVRSSELLRYLAPAENTDFRLKILEQDEPNAFALQQSEIIVTTALLDTLRSSNEEAFVLAHELGHLGAKSRSIAAALVSDGPSAGSEVAEEEEADRFAYILLNHKGLDGSAGIPLLANLQAISNSPSLPVRKAALASWIVEQGPG